jgi:hypothetical protein
MLLSPPSPALLRLLPLEDSRSALPIPRMLPPPIPRMLPLPIPRMLPLRLPLRLPLAQRNPRPADFRWSRSGGWCCWCCCNGCRHARLAEFSMFVSNLTTIPAEQSRVKCLTVQTVQEIIDNKELEERVGAFPNGKAHPRALRWHRSRNKPWRSRNETNSSSRTRKENSEGAAEFSKWQLSQRSGRSSLLLC